MSEQINELMDNFDRLTEPKFKEFLYVFLKKYYHNATRDKMAHILLNLPIGFFLNKADIYRLFDNKKPLSYKELMKLLLEKDIKKIIVV